MQRAIERLAVLSPLALAVMGCTSSSTPAAQLDSAATDAPASDAVILAEPDALAATSIGDGACNSTQVISAASFDQSCTSDLDCVGVGQGSVCLPCEIDCPSAAINKDAMAVYQAVVASSPAGSAMVDCGCPAFGSPCCRGGQCSANCDNDITDLDACAAAGGECVPFRSMLEGGLACARISYCAANPSSPGPTISVCCPGRAVGDGGGD